MRKFLFGHFLTNILLTFILLSSFSHTLAEVTLVDVLRQHTIIAHAQYEDALIESKELDHAIQLLIASPSKKKLDNARLEWIKARIPYQQSEVHRFGHRIMNLWNRKVNAWALDEGFIDYVDNNYVKDDAENPLNNANIIANNKIVVNGKEVDTSVISPELLQNLHGAGNIDTNITTGYHVIEFLLWGQDLNTTVRGPGNRPYTDFDTTQCTGGNCKKRADYLKAASKILISDLEKMTQLWNPDGEVTKMIMQDLQSGLSAMVIEMSSLSYGELAGERMNLGLVLHDSNQEIDRFSDNTHASYLNNIMSIMSNYTGEYTRINGEIIRGPSLSDLINSKNKNLDSEIKNQLSKALKDAYILAERAEHLESYDQMINSNNPEGNRIVRSVIDDLITLTESLKKIFIALDLKEFTEF
ncbi:MAG: peptidase [Candidatus Liberibacter ctenarytainae]|uniref:Peptidase n=1 Tax=Candidatus Liberibacter ctenarytainae TaxID=2020335 RepID=A0A937AK41_9HYPH|nr:peptidase [Candidatus Liberibacter ctenarytainae]